MAKYDGWTFGETEALLNIVGGTDVARAVLRGERRLVVKERLSFQQQPSLEAGTPGVVISKLRLEPSRVRSINDAIKLGHYNDYNGEIPKVFADEEIGFDEVVNIKLVRFDMELSHSEMSMWASANRLKPMQAKHLLAIGIQHPDEQNKAMIIQMGSTGRGDALCLYGQHGSRALFRYVVGDSWHWPHLFGFLDYP